MILQCWNSIQNALRMLSWKNPVVLQVASDVDMVETFRIEKNPHGTRSDTGGYGCQPKNMGPPPPKSSILIGFSIIFTIHFGGFPLNGVNVSSMVVFGSRKRWDRWHSPSPNWQEKYHLYTTYSPCLLGGYMLPTTFYGNQKQPLNIQYPVKQLIMDW